MAALVFALLMRGLRGIAAILEGVARVIRAGAQQLGRAADAARARAKLAPVAGATAAPPGAVPAAEETAAAPEIAADKTIAMPVSDKTIVAAPAFLSAGPPALPPPRPQWGRGPVLPPPRRAEWRAAMKPKAGEGAETSEPTTTVETRSDS